MMYTFSAEHPRPDADSVRRVRSCCHLLTRRWEALEQDFARELERVDPVAGPRLVADGAVREILVSVVEAASSADPVPAERRWEALGARARSGGYAEGRFVWVGHALVRAVRQILADEWSSATSSSWMAVYTWMARSMEAGAASAPSAPSAPSVPSLPSGPSGPGRPGDPGGPGGPADDGGRAPWGEVVTPPGRDAADGPADDAGDAGEAGDGGRDWGYDDLVAQMEQGGLGRPGRPGRRRR